MEPALERIPQIVGALAVTVARQDQHVHQWIEGSESSSQRMTDLFGFGACRLGGLVAICWFSLL